MHEPESRLKDVTGRDREVRRDRLQRVGGDQDPARAHQQQFIGVRCLNGLGYQLDHGTALYVSLDVESRHDRSPSLRCRGGSMAARKSRVASEACRGLVSNRAANRRE